MTGRWLICISLRGRLWGDSGKLVLEQSERKPSKHSLTPQPQLCLPLPLHPQPQPRLHLPAPVKDFQRGGGGYSTKLCKLVLGRTIAQFNHTILNSFRGAVDPWTYGFVYYTNHIQDICPNMSQHCTKQCALASMHAHVQILYNRTCPNIVQPHMSKYCTKQCALASMSIQ